MNSVNFDVWQKGAPVVAIGGNGDFNVWSDQAPFIDFDGTLSSGQIGDVQAQGSCTATVSLGALAKFSFSAQGNSTGTVAFTAVASMSISAQGDSTGTIAFAALGNFTSVRADGSATATIAFTVAPTTSDISVRADGAATATIHVLSHPVDFSIVAPAFSKSRAEFGPTNQIICQADGTSVARIVTLGGLYSLSCQADGSATATVRLSDILPPGSCSALADGSSLATVELVAPMYLSFWANGSCTATISLNDGGVIPPGPGAPYWFMVSPKKERMRRPDTLWHVRGVGSSKPRRRSPHS